MFDQKSFDLGFEFRQAIHTLSCFTQGNGYTIYCDNIDRITAAADERGQVVTVSKTIDGVRCEISWKRRENTDI